MLLLYCSKSYQGTYLSRLGVIRTAMKEFKPKIEEWCEAWQGKWHWAKENTTGWYQSQTGGYWEYKFDDRKIQMQHFLLVVCFFLTTFCAFGKALWDWSHTWEAGDSSGSCLWFRVPVWRFWEPVFFCNAPCIFAMHPFFCSVPIFCSALRHYKKMSLVSSVLYNKLLHFFVVHWCITKINTLQKYVVHSINNM